MKYNVDSFWRHVNKTDTCWEWLGPFVYGYGKFHDRGKQFRAHRVSWELTNGPITDTLNVCHKCDNKKCVNPEHLFLGTNSDNMQDMVKKGRNVGNKRLSETDVLVIRALYHWSVFEQTEIAKEFGVTNANISMICRGQTWKHLRVKF